MTSRSKRNRRLATAVPLVLASAVVSTYVAGADQSPDRSSTVVPQPWRPPASGASTAEAVEAPASVSTSDEVLRASDRSFTRTVGTTSPGDIPASALAAYQRAEAVINAADPACGLSWQLIAAIGRVESDHGRFGGSVVGPSGVAKPSIIGPVLDGRNGTARIRDTDAGDYDGDLRFDRAVGPMQFIPSTWAVVGVDADDDGVRNPQDIDDAALGTAVYLCSGTEDLSAATGQRPAVLRYNHSDAYADLVLSIMNGYLDGDFAGESTPVVSARYAVDPEPIRPLEPAVVDLGWAAATPARATDPTDPSAPGKTDDELSGGVSGANPGGEAPGEALEPTGPVEQELEPTPPPVEEVPPVEEPPAEVPPVEEPPAGELPAEEPVQPPVQEPAEATVPEPGSLSLLEADAYCRDEGLEDDVLVADEPYDLCLVEFTLPDELAELAALLAEGPLPEDALAPQD